MGVRFLIDRVEVTANQEGLAGVSQVVLHQNLIFQDNPCPLFLSPQ